MQELIQPRKIIDDERKQIILQCIADKYAKQILKSIVKKPKSPLIISNEENIPMSTVYRKLQILHNGKLVAVSGSFNRDGKRYALYMSKIKEVVIYCSLEETIVECVLNDTKQEDIN